MEAEMTLNLRVWRCFGPSLRLSIRSHVNFTRTFLDHPERCRRGVEATSNKSRWRYILYPQRKTNRRDVESSRVGILDSVQENCAIISGMCALTDDKLAVVLDREPDQAKDLDASGPRIRCPKCGWEPRKHDLWSCDCGHLWNTFDTGGIWPACL